MSEIIFFLAGVAVGVTMAILYFHGTLKAHIAAVEQRITDALKPKS